MQGYLYDMDEAIKAAREAIVASLSYSGGGIPYSGPELTSPKLLAGGFTIAESLSEENLTHSIAESVDVTDVAITSIIRLGIEQGLRIAAYELKAKTSLLSKSAMLLEQLSGNDRLAEDEKWVLEYVAETLAHLIPIIQNPGMVKLEDESGT